MAALRSMFREFSRRFFIKNAEKLLFKNENACFFCVERNFRMSSCVPNSEFKERYEKAKEQWKNAQLPSLVNPKGVFANNELDLSDVQVYGFDYDYTLAVYKESLHYLLYDLGLDRLINVYKYPKEIENLHYKPGFPIRGLHYDVHEGLLMKIDTYHQIQLGSVYRGLKPLPNEEVQKIYGGTYIPQNLIRSSEPSEVRMQQFHDLFSVPAMSLLVNVQHFFEENKLPYHPAILFHDVQSSIRHIHPVLHEIVNDENIDKYLEPQPKLKTFFDRLKSANKKTFLLTNSPFKFVHCGMKYMMGPNWENNFDLVIFQARKPKFFMDFTRPFRAINRDTGALKWETISELQKETLYIEGSLEALLSMTGWKGDQVLYFGDQIYSDLADPSLYHGWRTGAIICEVEDEIEIINTEEYRRILTWLLSLEKLVEELQDLENAETIVTELLRERDELRSKTKCMFNRYFGSIFRTHHNPTYFCQRLFRYSDIYTASITHLLNYPLTHTFYPRRAALPHEARVPI